MNTERSPRRAPLPPPPQDPPRPAVPPRPAAPPRPFLPPRPAGPPPPSWPPAARPSTGLLAGLLSGIARSRRPAAAVVCLVLGVGLLGGAAAGAWLTGAGGGAAARQAFEEGRSLWRQVPVDVLFPPELTGEAAGPGGADRRWSRVAVAPDGGCREAFDPLLADVLAQVGCHRLVRATYADETQTSLVTVGLLFTEADSRGMAELRERFEREELGARPDLMPRTYAPAGTLAEGFGDAQRAAWTVRVMTGLPVVSYAVSGFADGRIVAEPQPAGEAAAEGQDTTVALAGLGHDARGVARLVDAGLRRAADEADEHAEESR